MLNCRGGLPATTTTQNREFVLNFLGGGLLLAPTTPTIEHPCSILGVAVPYPEIEHSCPILAGGRLLPTPAATTTPKIEQELLDFGGWWSSFSRHHYKPKVEHLCSISGGGGHLLPPATATTPKPSTNI